MSRAWAGTLSDVPQDVAARPPLSGGHQYFWMGHEPKTMPEVYSHLFRRLTCDWRKQRQ
jgi:hypothetical protein